jgi:hypothetical protein
MCWWNISIQGPIVSPLPECCKPRRKELLYFSYITLATLGYGDVVPVTDGARSLAVLESLCGTIYMAILVARLIGLHLTQTGSPR